MYPMSRSDIPIRRARNAGAVVGAGLVRSTGTTATRLASRTSSLWIPVRGPAIACRKAHSMSATLPADRPSFSRTTDSIGTSWMRVMACPA
jgi:hypothetical protein